MINMGARLTVLTHPTLPDSGVIAADSSYQLETLFLGAAPSIQTAAGAGGEVHLRTRSFGATVGYTLRGFPVENVTGRLLTQPNSGPVIFRFERQPKQETQLPYTGLRDPGSIWPTYAAISGAVSLPKQARCRLRRRCTSGWYIQGGGRYTTGQHVPTNSRIDDFAGAYWSIWNDPSYGKFTLGMNFLGMHYANNQRLYIYGNGGYLSPGAYLLSSVPITFDGRYSLDFITRL